MAKRMGGEEIWSGDCLRMARPGYGWRGKSLCRPLRAFAGVPIGLVALGMVAGTSGSGNLGAGEGRQKDVGQEYDGKGIWAGE